MLDTDAGICEEYVTQYTFNKESGECLPFRYGGCGGNSNRFKDMEGCEEMCRVKETPDGEFITDCLFTGTLACQVKKLTGPAELGSYFNEL